jgi:uncharacterized membrane protein YfcA
LLWPDFPPAFCPLAVFAIVLTGVSKGGFGGGVGGFAVPIMSMMIAPAEVAALMLPILCAMDVFGVHAWRGRWSAQHLRMLLPGAALGVVLGALAFGALSANAVRLLVGFIAVVFALNRWFALAERLAARLALQPRPPGRVAGLFWGTVSGFTSTLAHAGGPPFAVYMLPQKLDKSLLVGTSVLFFFVVNYTKLVPYYLLGQLNLGSLAASLLFAPLAPLGIWLGVWLNRRISEPAFYQVSYALLFATGTKLIYDALLRGSFSS